MEKLEYSIRIKVKDNVCELFNEEISYWENYQNMA